ncbi:MAG: pirin family protein [Paludibacter sp.]|nr:pirin family protein [Paludibacter sp.]
MKSTLHKADTRGTANYDWLHTHHTFSFANYFDRNRMNFGALRVLNDDWIAPAMGFGTHPHDNMEIITIPLSGVVEHKDSMGNSGTISAGEIQVMSAGTGIYHSEFNGDASQALTLLQIWILPNKRNVSSRYDQISLDSLYKKDELYQILSPNDNDGGVWIHQQAWMMLGDLSQGWEGSYTLKGANTGVYVFVIEGDVMVNDQVLSARDGLGVWDCESIHIVTTYVTRILIIEVPLKF